MVETIGYKFNTTTIKNPAYNKYLQWQKDKPLFNTFNISNANFMLSNKYDIMNLNNDIPALLIFILDNEVLEYIETENYIALVFDYKFKDENNLINSIPRNIKYIEFDSDSSFNNLISNYPPELEYLVLSYYYNQSLDYLPHSIKYLQIYWDNSNSLDNLPNSLEYLDITQKTQYNNNIDNDNSYTINYLPDNIKILLVGGNDEITINKLPRYLEVFQTFNAYNGVNLNLLELGNMQSLTEIYFPMIFNNPINSNNIIWSDTIKYLSFGEQFNQRIDNLPKYLEILEVGIEFNLEEHIILEKVKFPTTLKIFSYIDGFPKQKEKINLLNKIRVIYPTIQFIH